MPDEPLYAGHSWTADVRMQGQPLRPIACPKRLTRLVF
jgi:hypothetical protein